MYWIIIYVAKFQILSWNQSYKIYFVFSNLVFVNGRGSAVNRALDGNTYPC